MDDVKRPLVMQSSPSPIPDLIQRYLNGESLQVLARNSAVSRQTLYNWMLAETGPDYEALITQALVNRIADADQNLDDSCTMFDIARAREQAKFARMDFERRRPKLYGPKQEVQQDTTIRVVIAPIPHIDKQPSIISVPLQVIDNTESES